MATESREEQARAVLDTIEDYEAAGRYLVLCRDPEGPREGQMCLATRQVMSRGEAQEYLLSVDRSHHPVIVKITYMPAGLPDGIRNNDEADDLLRARRLTARTEENQKALLEMLVNSEDDTGCSGDLTVVSKSALEELTNFLRGKA